MKKIKFKKTILAAAFLAIGIVLPFFTAQIKEIGDTLLPMHIPVMLCGLLCGWGYGGAVGFFLPILRSLLFSMPPIYPNAVWMALELCTYGAVIGFVYSLRKNERLGYLYTSLVAAMIAGRIVWGIAKAILLGFRGSSFTFGAFFIGGFVDSFAGIVAQLILIPLIMTAISAAKKKKSKEK